MKKVVIGMVIFLSLFFRTEAMAAAIMVATPDDVDVKYCYEVWMTQDVIAVSNNGKEVFISKGEKMEVLSPVEENIYLCEYRGQLVKADLEYALININEYIPSIKVSLDMAKKMEYTMGNEVVEQLSDHAFYTSESAKNDEAWLRLEVAKKLAIAQERFVAEGYTLVVHDAYRPYRYTKEMYEEFKEYLDTKDASFENEWFGNLGIGWFLAKNASSHNYGIAVDVTLADIATGEELAMPSTLTNLDKRSAREYFVQDSEEARNANHLREVMMSLGFSDLRSEWWHFQDNSINRGEPSDLDF